MSEEKELKLLEKARDVFMQYGIKSVNMDDMARHLGISKKTLYLYVKDKEELVHKSVFLHGQEEDEKMKEICAMGLNAIDELLEIMNWVTGILNKIHPSIVYDLEKYHPEVHYAMFDQRQNTIYECMMKNMKKGQREGLYRKDFNVDAITKFYIARLEIIFDQKLFPANEWSLPQVYMELFKYHVRGIASEKGFEYLATKKLKTTK
jgi:hypothetical protein